MPCSPGVVATMENLDLGQDGLQRRPLRTRNRYQKTKPTNILFFSFLVSFSYSQQAEIPSSLHFRS